jgi:hypothetical protein
LSELAKVSLMSSVGGRDPDISPTASKRLQPNVKPANRLQRVAGSYRRVRRTVSLG